MIPRLLIAAVLIALIQGAVVVIRQKRAPTTIRPPTDAVAHLPKTLGGWKGDDSPIDPQLSAAIGASQVVDRLYKDGSGASLLLEIATFETDELTPPHMPQTCYRNVGWTLKEQKDVEIKISDGLPRAGRILTFEQEAQRLHVLFWYQFGDAHVLDYNTLRRERANHFGEQVWPPLVKVMIQTGVSDSTAAEDQLLSFGETVLAWTKRL